jgi:UDP-N-acetyl-2-amino-2-deoxyglucuronate dehydrogenase
MNFGIIGAGTIGHFHARAIRAMTGGTLHSVFTKRADAADAFAREHSIRGYSELGAFLADPALDIVTIATPSGAHLEPTLAALAAGKHVLCEKPLEITTDRIDHMMAAAREANKMLAAILNRRFHPAMEAIRQAMEAGRTGRLTSASAYIKWYRDQAYYDSAAWRGTWALDGGGALINQAIHTIDALLYLAGPVRCVQGSTACLAHERIEVEDIGLALLEFASGARGVIEASTCIWSKDGQPARIQICGTDGSIFLADETIELWDFREELPSDTGVRDNLMKRPAAGLGAKDPRAIDFTQHQRNFEEVVAAIQEGREPSTSAAQARQSVALVNAIYQSVRNGGGKVYL